MPTLRKHIERSGRLLCCSILLQTTQWLEETMTVEQYRHWVRFSMSMAWRYPNATKNRRKRLASEVKRWFFWRSFQKDWCHMIDWDNSERLPESERRTSRFVDYDYCCDLFSDFFEEHNYHHRDPDREYRFYTQLACCIRAGIDVASEPSCGVVGFTVGDLKRIFGGNVPEWINEAYDKNLNNASEKDDILL